MITPSFSLTATERVLPKLALDFTTANLDSIVTFTRATSASNPATYVNSSGYITAATNNQPRFDYNLNTGGACKGLLIEESRTNYLKYSSQFDVGTSIWALSNANITGNQMNGPDNILSADKLTGFQAYTPGADVGSKIYYVSNSNSTTNINAPVTGSIYIYAPSAQNVQVGLFQWGGANAYTEVAIPANTWTRATITTTFASGNGQIGLVLYPGNSTIYIWGAQLEAGSFPTSYIPTTTTALTRNADVATMTGTNFSSWFNQSEGAMYCEYNVPSLATPYFIPYQIDDGTNDNAYAIYRDNSNTNMVSKVRTNSSNVVSINTTVTSTFGINKNTFSYKLDNFVTSFNGTSYSTDLSGALPTVNQMRFGSAVADTNTPLNGYLRKFMYWPQRITNAEAQAFSK